MICEDCRNVPICVRAELLKAITENVNIPDGMELDIVKCSYHHKVYERKGKKGKAEQKELEPEPEEEEEEEIPEKPTPTKKPTNSVDCPKCGAPVEFMNTPPKGTPAVCPGCKERFTV